MQNPQTESLLLKPNRPVGIIGYGAYVPRYRLPNAEIAKIDAGFTCMSLRWNEKSR